MFTKQLGPLGIFKYGGHTPTFFERVTGIQFGETLQKASYKNIPEDIQIQIDVEQLKNEKIQIEQDVQALEQKKIIGEAEYNNLNERIQKNIENNTTLLSNYYKKQAIMNKVINDLMIDKINAKSKEQIDIIDKKIVKAGSEQRELQERVTFLDSYNKSLFDEYDYLKKFIIKQSKQIKELKESSPTNKIEEQMKENKKNIEELMKTEDNIIRTMERINIEYNNDIRNTKENFNNEIGKINEQYDIEIAKVNSDIDIAMNELKSAKDDDKANIQNKLDLLKNNLNDILKKKDDNIKTMTDNLKNTITNIDNEKEFKLKQANKALDEVRNKIKNMSDESNKLYDEFTKLRNIIESGEFTEKITEEYKKLDELHLLKKDYIEKYSKDDFKAIKEAWYNIKRKNYFDSLKSVITKTTNRENIYDNKFNIKSPANTKNIKGLKNYVLILNNALLYGDINQYQTNFDQTKINPYIKKGSEVVINLYDKDTPSKISKLDTIKKSLSDELIKTLKKTQILKNERNEYLLNTLSSELKK